MQWKQLRQKDKDKYLFAFFIHAFFSYFVASA